MGDMRPTMRSFAGYIYHVSMVPISNILSRDETVRATWNKSLIRKSTGGLFFLQARE